MSTRTRALRATSTAAAVSGLILLGMTTPAYATAPVAAHPVAPAVTDAPGNCQVSDATLTWGVKESFRAYISGTIANGEWTTEGNAGYETPSFSWSAGTGTINGNDQTGMINHTGTVKFTGHGGLLQVTLANPGIEILTADEAYLLLDLSSTKQTGESDVSLTQVRAATLDLAGAMSADGTTLTIDAASAQLTAEGASGFAGFYETGAELDPINLTAAAPGCSLEPGQAAAPSEEPTTKPAETTTAAREETTAPEEPANGIPWLPIGIGGGALLVILGVAGALLAGNRKKSALAQATLDDQAQEAAVAEAPQESGTHSEQGNQK